MGLISPVVFRRKLLRWSEENPRNLPWIGLKDPYPIWISEVILQQTRSAQAVPYYHRFLSEFPDLKSLANSSLDHLLIVWEGLGYYSRARNLHKAAIYIQKELNGKFPTKFEEILNLPGVGEYTASAIASFAYKDTRPVVDGNVIRVLSRICGLELNFYTTKGRKLFYDWAKRYLDAKNPDLYNQAIMNFGATQCIPQQPLCGNCPFMENCLAYAENRIKDLPVKKIRKKPLEANLHYFLVEDVHRCTLVRQRDENGIWKQLFELPGFERDESGTIQQGQMAKFLNGIGIGKNKYKLLKISNYNHQLTHRKLNLHFYWIEFNGSLGQVQTLPFQLASLKNLKKFAFPKIIRLFLDQNLNRGYDK
ncbi:MAG: A/G-specific adenine glycosylase [Saprospiraceae bacterium]|nr:A/G-specific adenine glycosylase [Saprospiraceae bacterium]